MQPIEIHLPRGDHSRAIGIQRIESNCIDYVQKIEIKTGNRQKVAGGEHLNLLMMWSDKERGIPIITHTH